MTSMHVTRFMGSLMGHLVSSDFDDEQIDVIAETLAAVREREGRLFLIGNGGGAGHASHAAADFRLKCGIDARVLTDNVSELTARINDRSWISSIVDWLADSGLNERDALFVFSVGGGDHVSRNLAQAIWYAQRVRAEIMGVTGSDEGDLALRGTHVVVVSGLPNDLVTPLVEAYQAIVWHALVSHPVLAK